MELQDPDGPQAEQGPWSQAGWPLWSPTARRAGICSCSRPAPEGAHCLAHAELCLGAQGALSCLPHS